MPWAARRVRWAKVLRRIGGLLGQAAKNCIVHVQALFSPRFPDWLRLRRLGSFAEISLSVGLVWLMRNRAAPMGSSANGDGSIRRVCLAKTPCALPRARSAEQPSIVLFMFKHCFHYDFTIGFVCGIWVRLRKASLSVGFVWLMRNRAAPTGSSATLSCGHRSALGSFGQRNKNRAREDQRGRGASASHRPARRRSGTPSGSGRRRLRPCNERAPSDDPVREGGIEAGGAAEPCRTALREERALPSGVFGPRLRRPFLRLASRLASLIIPAPEAGMFLFCS